MNEKIERDLGCLIPGYAFIGAILIGFFMLLVWETAIPGTIERYPIRVGMAFTFCTVFTKIVLAYLLKHIVTNVSVFTQAETRNIDYNRGERSGYIWFDQ